MYNNYYCISLSLPRVLISMCFLSDFFCFLHLGLFSFQLYLILACLFLILFFSFFRTACFRLVKNLFHEEYATPKKKESSVVGFTSTEPHSQKNRNFRWFVCVFKVGYSVRTVGSKSFGSIVVFRRWIAGQYRRPPQLLYAYFRYGFTLT